MDDVSYNVLYSVNKTTYTKNLWQAGRGFALLVTYIIQTRSCSASKIGAE